MSNKPLNESASAVAALRELLAANPRLPKAQKAALALAISVLDGRQWDDDIHYGDDKNAEA